MRWDWQVVGWAILALVLIAGEAVLPGAALLWLGLAAAIVFFVVLLLPDLPVLAQGVLFIVLSFASVEIYRRHFRKRAPVSDAPTLNRRAAQLVGRVVPLERAIVNGEGRVQIADAYWDVRGDDLPAGTPVRIVGVDGMTLLVERA
jgi:membrane protein implicated in regulation of membrane protease activity